MLRIMMIAAALAAVQWASATRADACNGDKTLFQDDFSVHDATWGVPSADFEMKDGKAVLKPAPAMSRWQLQTGFAFGDADICLTVTLLETSDPTRSSAGVAFWAKDARNLYVLSIAPNGFYQVSRLIAGNWAPEVISWTPSDAIKQGPNQPNNLRVTLKGQSVAVMINDKDLVRFRAQPPETQSNVGLYAVSGPAKADAWQFTDLKVTNVK